MYAATADSLEPATPLAVLSLSVFVIVTFAAAVCAMGGKPGGADGGGRGAETQEERVRRSIMKRDRLNTADTVGMESNVLYAMQQNSRPSIPPQALAAEDWDEDELANQKMKGAIDRHRAMSLARSRSKQAFQLASDRPPWLHNNVKKREAIELLKSYERGSNSGTLFLVRIKNVDKGQYALDTLVSGSPDVESFLISRAGTGQMEFDGVLLKSGARTVEAVIAELYGSNMFVEPLTEFVPSLNDDAGPGTDDHGRGRRLSSDSVDPHRNTSHGGRDEDVEI
mmetsp:Transcript_36899/g.96648  ORF Transcript_36899/g.96648 Transcript_36899/m.96648 type:complete len:282 (-) Transcript_36899:1625-2470(-)